MSKNEETALRKRYLRYYPFFLIKAVKLSPGGPGSAVPTTSIVAVMYLVPAFLDHRDFYPLPYKWF